jgi:hypothetical protein
LHSAGLCSRGKLSLERILEFLGGGGGDGITQNVLSHRREEIAEEMLVLVIPAFIRQVGDMFNIYSHGCSNLLARCDEGSIKVPHKFGAPKIWKELSIPYEVVCFSQPNGDNFVDWDWSIGGGGGVGGSHSGGGEDGGGGRKIHDG